MILLNKNTVQEKKKQKNPGSTSNLPRKLPVFIALLKLDPIQEATIIF